MDPLHFCIAVVPLAVYLLLIGILNLRRRPFVTSGARDAAAVGIGICGLMMAGPMELFMPQTAAAQYGSLVWLMMLAFYGLMVSLTVLLMRVRIVAYNITSEQLRPILTKIALEFDKSSRWSGDGLLIPAKKIHLHMDPALWNRSVQLTASGIAQSYEGWNDLEAELKQAVKSVEVRANLLGINLLGGSLALALVTLYWMLMDQESVVAAFREMTQF